MLNVNIPVNKFLHISMFVSYGWIKSIIPLMYANTYFFPTSLLIYYIIKNLPVAKWEVVSLDILIYLIPNEMEQLISFLGLIF